MRFILPSPLRVLALLSLLSPLGLATSLPAQTVVTLQTTDAEAAETATGQAANPGNIRVLRTGGSTVAPLTVWIRVRGTAVQGVDYQFTTAAPLGATVVIPAGREWVDLGVLPFDDALTEGAETVRIDLQDTTPSGAPVPYQVGTPDRGQVDLLDNEDPALPPRAVVSVIALDAQGSETPVGSNPASFAIQREGNTNAALSIRFSLGGSAIPGVDYLALPDTIPMAAGVTSAIVVITPINDALVEETETVTLTIEPPVCAAVVPPPADCYVAGLLATASVTVLSEDLPPPPTVRITAPASGTSRAAPGVIPLSFEALDLDGTIARYAVLDGAAVVVSNVVQYPAPPAAGTAFSSSVTLTNVRAGLHLLRVKVWDNQGVSALSEAVQAVVTNIPPVYPKMSVTAVDAEAAEVTEGGEPNPAVFVITVDAPMPTPQYVVYRLSSPGPGWDFIFPTNYSESNWPMFWPVGPTDYGYAYFPTGVTRVEVVATPVDDRLREGPETLTLTLSYPFVFTERTFEGIVQFTEGGFFTPPFDPYAPPPHYFDYDIGSNSTASAVILDNDTEATPFAIVAITTTDAEAGEVMPGAPANPGVFTISRDGPTNLALTVNYAFTAPSFTRPATTPTRTMAQHGVDYESLPHPGTVIIPAGSVSTEIVIRPIHDLILEGNELVQITLLPSSVAPPDPSSYLLYTNSVANLVIQDLPLPAFTPVLRILALDTQAIEEDTYSRTASFLVERNGNLGGDLTVRYSVSGTASNGVDYETLPGVVTIPAGSPRATIIVTPIADGIPEPVESVGLTLQPPPLDLVPPPYVLSAASTMRSSAGVTIRDTQLYPGHPFLTRRARLLQRLRNRYVVVPLPVAALIQPAQVSPLPPMTVTWAVEASSDLVSWEEIGVTTDPEEFVDVNPGESGERFYRFRQVPPAVP